MSNFWGAHHFGLWRKLIGLSWHSLADCFAAVWRVLEIPTQSDPLRLF